ncbi:DUF2357 domain-containing protein [Actinoplanes sp. NPDC051513]|uniref:DUF2357 domain-containing protein n=1 Tax=Actinoplanes sp. NPDC051513 TaxID=3363908 RepID=UPI003794E5E9
MVSELPSGPPPAVNGSVALIEGQRYWYELHGVDQVSRIEPAELFDPDDVSLGHGRIAPGQSVGTIVIVVYSNSAILSAVVDVVPAKLTQRDEYRQMLSDITKHAAEAVLQGFAPAALEAAIANHSTDLLYQRFVILDSHLRSDEFEAVLGQILGDPHLEWRAVGERQSPGSAYPVGPAFGRALGAPGPRRPWLQGRGRPALSTMPTMLERSRHETTVDTAPNRFVKYALETWRALARQLRDGLVRDDLRLVPGPMRRGKQAADEAIEILDDILNRPLFRQVGRLDRFPSSSQVLLRRAGYRQLFHMFVLIDAGLELPWDSDADDVYNPTLRNVATLYELWSYLTLVDVVGEVCGQRQTAQAFTPSANGLSLRLMTGVESALVWSTTRRGRPLEVRLMFNRQFTAGNGSWTAPMRPDCSILIRPLPLASARAEELDVWVHFDAKYRVSGAAPIDFSVEDEDGVISRGAAKRDDLLKMHAYRDAIHRTAGAYVLYPGDVTVDRRQFSEALPGLGAFPLRPGAEGAYGVEEISIFLTGVLDHVADQATQHERERFWRARIYAAPAQEHPRLPPAPFLDRPPADTDVLVGYVRGSRHRAWIDQTRSYNVRADNRTGALHLGSRELSARLVLLYEEVRSVPRIFELARAGEWRAVDRQELIGTGYPEPRGLLYLVTSLDVVADPPAWLTDVAIDALKPASAARGAPFAVTWLDLMASVRAPQESG